MCTIHIKEYRFYVNHLSKYEHSLMGSHKDLLPWMSESVHLLAEVIIRRTSCISKLGQPLEKRGQPNSIDVGIDKFFFLVFTMKWTSGWGEARLRGRESARPPPRHYRCCHPFLPGRCITPLFTISVHRCPPFQSVLLRRRVNVHITNVLP